MKELMIGAVIALAGLYWIEHRLAGRGERRLRPPRRGWRGDPRRGALGGGLLLLLGILALGPRLALRYGEGLVPRAVAAGLFLLLLARLWLLLPRLRPLLGRRLPARPNAVFFLLPAVVYLAWMPWATAQRPPDGDEPFNLLLVHSLAYDFDTDLTNNYAAEDSRRFVPRALAPQPSDPEGRNGELYSRHNALLPALLAPAYRLAGKHGALAVMCLLAAALAWMTLRLARHLFADRPGPVLVAWYLLAFTSPLLVYSHQVWVEIPAALLLAAALDVSWSMAADPTRRRAWLPLLVPLALLPLLKLRFLLVAVPVLLPLVRRLGRRGRRFLLLALAGCVALAAAVLAFNQLRYGNPLKYHHLDQMSFYWTRLHRYPLGLAGLFFDTAFGLFATGPVWVLVFAWGRDKAAAVGRLLWIMTPYLVVLIPRSEWYGGWSPPFRYGCVALPLFALLLVPPLERRRGAGARVLLGGLGAATALLTALWVARPGWTYNISDGRGHLVDFLSIALGIDASRFFPSATRPNLALLVWPPLVVLAVLLLWRGRRRAPAALAWLGAALPLAGLAAVAAGAHHLPTRLVEAEDPYVVHDGGSPWPYVWAVGRPRFRGGWKLRPGDRLVVPVVPGGRALAVEIELRRFGVRRPAVRVRAGDAAARWARVPKGLDWERLRLAGVPWPRGADRLEIELRLAGEPDPEAAVLVDRLSLAWSDAAAPPQERGRPARAATSSRVRETTARIGSSLTWPLPARWNAVPWSTEVRTYGRPIVQFVALPNAAVLTAISP